MQYMFFGKSLTYNHVEHKMAAMPPTYNQKEYYLALRSRFLLSVTMSACSKWVLEFLTLAGSVAGGCMAFLLI